MGGGLSAMPLGAKIVLKKISILLFLLSWTLFAQNTLIGDSTFNVNSVKLHYQEFLVAKAVSEFSYDEKLISIDVINSNDSIIQNINFSAIVIGSPLLTKNNPYCILGDSGITLDYNFDGLDDIALWFNNEQNNHAINGYYIIYLFDDSSQHFIEYNEELINPLPLPAKKRIECTYVFSTFEPHTLSNYYEWVNGELVLVESIESQQLSEQPEEGVILIKEIKTSYINGIEYKVEEDILKINIY